MDRLFLGNRMDSDDSSTFEKVSIKYLHSAPMYPVIVAVVIAKCEPKFVATKKGGDRYVFNFTLRDSPEDTINAACWGDEVQVKGVCETFAIGDVVSIKNPQIVMKQSGSAGEKYRPFTTSQHELNISPKNSVLSVCSPAEGVKFRSLIFCPVHSGQDYLPLADIMCNAQNIDGKIANLLVAVKKIGVIQVLTTKDGRPVKKLELEVFDNSHPSFPILIWDKEVAHFIINNFHPKSIVLISDIRINFNRYSKGLMGTSVSNTVFTPNPAVPDGRVLYQYIQSLPEEDLVTPETGTNQGQIYTVDQVRRMLHIDQISVAQDFEGTVFAFISYFNIDGSSSRVTSLRCPECKLTVREPAKRCINGACEVGAGIKTLNPEEVFDVAINLTDHTGTLARCSVYGNVIQDMLKCTVSEFHKLSEGDKSELKWKFLLEFFKFQFKISQGSVRPTVRITSCQLADLSEVMAFYKTLT